MSLTEGSCSVSIDISITSKQFYILCVLLTVHPGMILVNKQLDAQFFMYVYFYSIHVSGSHEPIIRRINVSILLHTRRSSTQSDINQVSQ